MFPEPKYISCILWGIRKLMMSFTCALSLYFFMYLRCVMQGRWIWEAYSETKLGLLGLPKPASIIWAAYWTKILASSESQTVVTVMGVNNLMVEEDSISVIFGLKISLVDLSDYWFFLSLELFLYREIKVD